MIRFNILSRELKVRQIVSYVTGKGGFALVDRRSSQYSTEGWKN